VTSDSEARPARQRRVSARGQETRELILETALEVIGRRGYGATSLREIADAVGVTQAGMLHHFGTKEALLVEVLRQRDIANRRALDAQPGDEPTPVRVARHNANAPALMHLYVSLQAAASTPGHPAHDFFRARQERVHDLVVTDVRARQAAGEVRADLDPDRVATVLLALSDGLQAQLGADPDIDIAATIEWLWAQFT